MPRTSKLATVLAVLALVGAACGADDDSAAETTTSATAATTPTTSAATTTTTVAVTTTAAAATTTTLAGFEPTDPSIAVNGGWLAYECRGDGGPTVVVDLGLADKSRTKRDPNWVNWGDTLDLIAETNTVCIYGRRGVVGSEPVSGDPLRSTQDHVDDLSGLVDALDLETPVILVGHSLAAYNIRLLASQQPDMVAGLVFVDGTDPGIDDFVPTPKAPEWMDFPRSAEQVAVVTDLGDLPVYVLTATTGAAGWWFELQDNLRGLSTNSIQTKVEATHANIYSENPETVVAAVAWVTEQSG